MVDTSSVQWVVTKLLSIVLLAFFVLSIINRLSSEKKTSYIASFILSQDGDCPWGCGLFNPAAPLSPSQLCVEPPIPNVTHTTCRSAPAILFDPLLPHPFPTRIYSAGF